MLRSPALLLKGLLAAVLLLGVYWLVTQPLVEAQRSQPPAVDGERLKAHVRFLSQTAYPRSGDQPAKLAQAAAYIEHEWSQLPCTVETQTLAGWSPAYRNLIARFGPATGPTLVIGAHYDAFGDAAAGQRWPGGYDPTTHTPGADDNASGVAGLLELARMLAASPPRIAVELVAYTLEEPPYFRGAEMGSLQHARRLRESGKDVVLMISLEMIGYFRDEVGSQRYPLPGMQLFYPDRGDFIAVIGRPQEWSAVRQVKAHLLGASDLPVYSFNAPALVPGIDFSDHRSYWAEGFPALMITDTAFFRNPHYHRPGDVAETLNYERMAKVIQGVFALVQNYDAVR